MSTQSPVKAPQTVRLEEPVGRVIGIACLWLPVREIARSIRWYTEILGLELLQKQPDGGQALLRLSAEGPGLFLKQVEEPPALHFDHGGHRTALFELRVDGLEALRQRLVAGGRLATGEIESSACGEYLNLVDPDGNKIQLWAPPLERQPA
jgi:catechol 2,3-dioxygenase-like lactoylglutathione lyase family enzyme